MATRALVWTTKASTSISLTRETQRVRSLHERALPPYVGGRPTWRALAAPHSRRFCPFSFPLPSTTTMPRLTLGTSTSAPATRTVSMTGLPSASRTTQSGQRGCRVKSSWSRDMNPNQPACNAEATSKDGGSCWNLPRRTHNSQRQQRQASAHTRRRVNQAHSPSPLSYVVESSQCKRPPCCDGGRELVHDLLPKHTRHHHNANTPVVQAGTQRWWSGVVQASGLRHSHSPPK